MPKNIRYLTKRRRNQLINCNLIQVNIPSTVSNVEPITIQEAEYMQHDNIFTSNTLPTEPFVNVNDKVLEQLEPPNFLFSETEKEEANKIELQNANFVENTEISLQTDLQTLIIENNMPHTTANKLLKVLRKHGHENLPSDVRILLATPRNASTTIKSLSTGCYKHFGLFRGLERSIYMYSNFIKTNEIRININIDGLPMSKSSGSQFWPILLSIEGIDVYTLPILIGVYHGMHKPQDANEFLSAFVNEFILLSENGIIVSNKKYIVRINAIICDAPAKVFVTFTKGHTGYHSCSKCIQEGDSVQNRVVLLETNSILRTDSSFKNRIHLEHHTGDSILENLPIGMVSQIPLDYMHLVCLGVMKRLLQFWVRGNKTNRLSKENINFVSHNLIAIKPYITSEFSRKPRDLSEVDRWKATEFRQFLLYTGIVIMKSVLSRNCYNHFVSLSVAIRILTDPQLCLTDNAYAKSLLLWFVSNYNKIYGDEYISYNVHNLIHLADDVQTFGCLDNFSNFKFENHMQKIKRKVRQSQKLLEELSNRIFEELQLPIQPYPIVQYPIVAYKQNKEISYLQFKSFKISKYKNNNYALLDDNSVVCILDFVEENSVLYIRAQRFLNPKPFFNVPCSSEKLGIFLISNTTISDIIKVPLTQIYKKCIKIVLFDEVDSFVTIPLQHTNN